MWQRLAKTCLPSVSQTRWWSEYEYKVYLLDNWEHVQSFIANTPQDHRGDDFGSNSKSLKRLRTIMEDVRLSMEVELELKVVVASG